MPIEIAEYDLIEADDKTWSVACRTCKKVLASGLSERDAMNRGIYSKHECPKK